MDPEIIQVLDLIKQRGRLPEELIGKILAGGCLNLSILPQRERAKPETGDFSLAVGAILSNPNYFEEVWLTTQRKSDVERWMGGVNTAVFNAWSARPEIDSQIARPYPAKSQGNVTESPNQLIAVFEGREIVYGASKTATTRRLRLAETGLTKKLGYAPETYKLQEDGDVVTTLYRLK